MEHRVKCTILYYLSFIVLGLAGASLGPTLPFLAEISSSTIGAISSLLAARSLGYLLGAIFGAGLYDRLPGHRLIAALLVGMSIVLGLAPVLNDLRILFAAMLLIGAFESTIDSGANMMLVWLFRERVGPYMNGLHFAFGVGAFLVPLLVAATSYAMGSPAWAYWLLSISAIGLAIPFCLVPSAVAESSPKTLAIADVAEASSPAASGSAASATDASATEAVKLPEGNAHKLASDSDRLRTNWHLAIAIGAFYFFYSGVEISFGNWIYTFATKTGLADELVANYLTSAFWGSFTCGRLLTIPLAATLHPGRLLWLCLISAAVAMLPMLIAPQSATAIWAGSILLGLTIAAIFPATLSFAERFMAIKGGVMRVFYTGVSMGSTFTPWLIGQLFESVSPYCMLIAVGGSLLLSIAAFAYVNRIATASHPSGKI